MDTSKRWVAFAIAAALAVAAGGWFLLVSPKRGEAALLQEQTAVQQAQNAQLETQLEVLRSKAAGLPEQEADLAEVAAKIPPGPALPELLRALTAAGRAAGVELTAITPGSPVPVTPAGTTTEQAAAGLAAVPLTMLVSGDFYELEQFVAGLEDLPRALRVTGLTLTDAEQGGGRSLKTSIAASVFVSTTDPAAAPAEAATDPAVAPGGTAPAAPAPEGTAAEPVPADASAPAS